MSKSFDHIPSLVGRFDRLSTAVYSAIHSSYKKITGMFLVGMDESAACITTLSSCPLCQYAWSGCGAGMLV